MMDLWEYRKVGLELRFFPLGVISRQFAQRQVTQLFRTNSKESISDKAFRRKFAL